MPTDTNTFQPDWERLVDALDERDRTRFEVLLRRGLKRNLAMLRDAAHVEAPDYVRAQAVGEWRRRFVARGGSKAAAQRRNYANLRGDKTYRQIERDLVSRHLSNILRDAHVPRVNAYKVSLPEACETYHTTKPQLEGSPVAKFASEVCERCMEAGAVEELSAELTQRLCAFVRTEDLSACAMVTTERLGPNGGRRQEPFNLRGVCTRDEVFERVCSSHLQAGVLRSLLSSRGTTEAIAALMSRKLLSLERVRVAFELVDALNGADRPGDERASRKRAVPAKGLDALLARMALKGARTVQTSLTGPEVAHLLAEALLDNPRYRAQFDQSVELRLRVRERVPETPMEAYPLARSQTRKVVLHVGPTNSGKTHDALQALAKASSGAYLGPLRLLAYEQFEELNRLGCPCSLLTGEEMVEVTGARHVASTVEMANLHKPIDVAVIDEAQMIADPDRGQHWTAALLGIPAREVHVCCAPHAERVLCELVRLTGDVLKIVRHERLVPLRHDRGRFHLSGDVQPGDALIVFSRSAVHKVASQVSAVGLRPSVIYGALPYEVRHEEARRFDEGKTDVVVATDAIGMGMNLPIRRIVFVRQEKYDGREMRMLRPEEVQQIAGRAGRFGRYDEGLFQSTSLRKEIFALYEKPVPDIVEIPVGIPDNIALVRGATLTESVLQWMAIEQPAPFRRIDTARDLKLIGEVESQLDESRRTDRATKELVLALATMPFDEDERHLRHAWRRMVEAELAGEEAKLPLPDAPAADAQLAWLEQDYRYCDLLYNYARSFGHTERLEELVARRTQISRTIMAQLAERTAV